MTSRPITSGTSFLGQWPGGPHSCSRRPEPCRPDWQDVQTCKSILCCLALLVQARKQGEQERKEKLRRALKSGQRIIIDLAFADKMTGAEVRSLCQQLSYSYSANSRAAQPAQLILTGYDVSPAPSGTSLAKHFICRMHVRCNGLLASFCTHEWCHAECGSWPCSVGTLTMRRLPIAASHCMPDILSRPQAAGCDDGADSAARLRL